MRHARPDYQRIQDPLHKIPQDETVFLIRGQDINGAAAVRAYAKLAADSGAPDGLVAAAYEHADRMDAWPSKKNPDL